MNGFDAETIQGWRDEGIAKLGERGWAVAARLLASDIHWLKGGWGRQDELGRCWDILEDLLDLDVEVKPRREPWLARFELGEVRYSIRGGETPELSTAVHCQDTPLAWRVLALTPDDDHSRRVRTRGQDLEVELGLTIDRPPCRPRRSVGAADVGIRRGAE